MTMYKVLDEVPTVADAEDVDDFEQISLNFDDAYMHLAVLPPGVSQLHREEAIKI